MSSLGIDISPLEPQMRLTREAGWTVLFWDWAFISEKPVSILKNAVGLHCEDGPALLYPDGFAVYALNGVRVSREIVETAASELDPRLLLTEANAEIRREILRKIGIERALSVLGSTVVDKKLVTIPAHRYLVTEEDNLLGKEWIDIPEKHIDYELVRLSLDDGRSRPYLKMLNPSIGVWHIEGVSPQCATIDEALHFRKPEAMRSIPVDDANGEDWYLQGDVHIWPAGAPSLKRYPAQIT
jgi:hypothetical protein